MKLDPSQVSAPSPPLSSPPCMSHISSRTHVVELGGEETNYVHCQLESFCLPIPPTHPSRTPSLSSPNLCNLVLCIHFGYGIIHVIFREQLTLMRLQAFVYGCFNQCPSVRYTSSPNDVFAAGPNVELRPRSLERSVRALS